MFALPQSCASRKIVRCVQAITDGDRASMHCAIASPCPGDATKGAGMRHPVAVGLLIGSTLLGACQSTPPPSASRSGSGPRIVGEESRLTSAPTAFAPTIAGHAELVWSERLSHAGATYIAPHFSRFALPPGAQVIVKSPDGKRSFRYAGDGKPGLRGEGFWAGQIVGDTAIVELYASVPLAAGAVALDRFAHGLPSVHSVISPHAICGLDDSQWARCYESSESTIYERSRAVARLMINGTAACTGWLVGSEGHLLTNAHCISSASEAANTTVELDAEGETCTTECSDWGACPGTIVATSTTLIKADTNADYALLKLPTNPTGTHGYLQLRANGAQLGERIYVPQHPAAWGKKIAVMAGSSFATVGSLTEPPCMGSGYTDVGYLADTQGGSSGSPVLGYADHLVVALHHCADCPNRAVPIQQVIESIGGLMPVDALGISDVDFPPAVTLTSPVAGATVSGVIDIVAHASDDRGVTQVDLIVDGQVVASSSAGPYQTTWDTTSVADGSHTVAATVTDSAGQTRTASATIRVKNVFAADEARYDAVLAAPACRAATPLCDSGVLLDGRGKLGPELDAPNTIGSSCADGDAGSYHADESVDAIRVYTKDGGNFAVGKTVVVEVKTWIWGADADYLDLYVTASAAQPAWTLLKTVSATGTRQQLLTAEYTLAESGLHAVRANLRYLGGSAACTSGAYDDHDDLVFDVASDTTAPTVRITTPGDGATVAGMVQVEAEVVDAGGIASVQLTANDAVLATATAAPYGASWDTSALANGSYTLSAVATDTAGNRATTSIQVTVDNGGPPPAESVRSAAVCLPRR
jgi:hypothetical protein